MPSPHGVGAVLGRSFYKKNLKNNEKQWLKLFLVSVLCVFTSVFASVFDSEAYAEDRAVEGGVVSNVETISASSAPNSSDAQSKKPGHTHPDNRQTSDGATADIVKTVETRLPAESPADVSPQETAHESVAEIPPVETTIVNTTLIAEVDATITVTLDGETLQSTDVHRSDDGALYVNAIPIFSALNNEFEYDQNLKALIVRRSQDNAVMELYTDTGLVKANGKALGKLKHFGEVSGGRFLLTPNAIAVLSGATGTFDNASNQFDFELDPRLRVATGFEVFVNDIALVNVSPEPKSIGSVLLLPLIPIAEELGHDVRVLDGTNIIRVRRAQDSAIFTLNLDTGLIKLRDRPYGVAKDVTYIDDINLLLPVSALEALTGTHVTVSGGSNRIDIELDRRLKNVVKPQASVSDIAKNTPFTPESVTFHLGPDSLNQVEADFRTGAVNGRLRFEVPDLPTTIAEAEPSWLSVEFAHLNGITGSIGDYAADFRELDGVGIRRIRGVSAVKETREGRWALAAGAPVIGGRRISDNQSRQRFGGIAGGARYASAQGWEAGAAFNVDTLNKDQMAVLSAISGKLGRKRGNRLQWDARADLGVFNGPRREKPVDIVASGNVRYDITESLTLDVGAEYTGAEFLRSDLDAEDQIEEERALLSEDEETVIDTRLGPDTRRRGADEALLGGSIRFSPRKNYGVLDRPAVSVRAQGRKTGLVSGTDRSITSLSYGTNISTAIANTGVNLALNASQVHVTTKNASVIETTVPEEDSIDNRDVERSWRYGARASKDFQHFGLQAQYDRGRRSGEALTENASATVTTRTFTVTLPKSARLNLTPSATANWNGEDVGVRGGLIANLNSGQLLGKKTSLQASLGVLQSVGGRAGAQTDKFLSMTLARQVKIGNNMSLGLAYRNDLRGNQRIGLQLDGRFEFNESRKYKRTESGRGILKGRVFLDKNRDGEKQDGEPGVNQALLQVRNTGLALRSAIGGAFTIQNIKEGLHEIIVDNESLPLGFAMPDSFVGRVSIVDGQITDISIPIVQRGQIRGFTFIDSDGDGKFTSGEKRIDGVKLSLKRETQHKDSGDPIFAHTTSFGQFAFDDLAAETYIVSVNKNDRAQYEPTAPITVDLSKADGLMMRVQIPLKPKDKVKLAKNSDLPDKDNSRVLDVKGPAPP